MKKKLNNSCHIEGLLYQHSLEEKVTGENSKNPGTHYIAGDVQIATDNDATNIVTVHYMYETEKTRKGKANSNYETLAGIINGKYGSIMKNGIENAVKLRIDTSIVLNEFYTEENGVEKFVSVKRNQGGFIHVANELNEDENERNLFDVDIIITGVTIKDGDPDLELPEKAIIKGNIFNYSKALLPVELSTTIPEAIAYFEGLDVSDKNPVFTELKGQQISRTIVRKIEEESAWGAPRVRELKNTLKEYEVSWARRVPYEWDDESTILVSELKDAVAEREIYLATLKKNREDAKATKNTGAFAKANNTTSTIAKGNFNF